MGCRLSPLHLLDSRRQDEVRSSGDDASDSPAPSRKRKTASRRQTVDSKRAKSEESIADEECSDGKGSDDCEGDGSCSGSSDGAQKRSRGRGSQKEKKSGRHRRQKATAKISAKKGTQASRCGMCLKAAKDWCADALLLLW